MLSWLELTAAGDEIFRRSKVGGLGGAGPRARTGSSSPASNDERRRMDVGRQGETLRVALLLVRSRAHDVCVRTYTY